MSGGFGQMDCEEQAPRQMYTQIMRFKLVPDNARNHILLWIQEADVVTASSWDDESAEFLSSREVNERILQR